MAAQSIAKLAGEDERYIKVRQGEVRVGEPLPWDVFDHSDNLLLSEGTVVSTDKQLERLLAEGLYRRLRRTSRESVAIAGRDPITGNASNPFGRVSELMQRLHGFLNRLASGEVDDAEVRGLRLAAALRELVERDADAALGASHLDRDYHYVYSHALYSALLTDLVGKRLGLDEERRDIMLAAALTANIGMHRLQQELVSQAEPLTREQRQAIENHPLASTEILRRSGVTSDPWLEIVLQHHERLDGAGYPRGIAGDDFLLEARIVAIADRYHAMVSGREYREGLMPRSALKKLFMEDGGAIDNELAQVFIKELGFFPPGSFVTLASGECGLVVRRTGDVSAPEVALIRGADGQPYMEPLLRPTSTERHAIKGLQATPSRIPFHLGHIWGYED
jgi:HD-GYP domain-containing protein (c-di-GMP phosphodiesterase class II)